MLWIGNQNNYEGVCLYASLHIEINLGFFELLKKQEKWYIYIEHNESFVAYLMHETFNSDGVLSGICFLNKRDLANGLPTFRFKLATTIKHGNENLLLTIPMPASLQSTDECAICLVQNAPTPMVASRTSVKLNASSIIAQYNPHPVRSQKQERIIMYCIRNEQSKTKAGLFLELQAIADEDLILKLYWKVRKNGIIDDDLPHAPR
uniref:Uncharacterized protein n=1 Tax=Anopheles culicifacies TaxID=139723 RepID=A0A182MHW2_9DIPT